MLPSEYYRQKLAEESYAPDPRQEMAVAVFDEIQQALTKGSSLFGRQKPVPGLYLWGQVGIGKTFLMDIFFDTLTEERKERLHYQHFMASVHEALQAETGHSDPLELIGKRMATEIRVLCLDELYITDIGDGMIIYRLFDALFRHGLTLITTSNFPPERLYKDDLQPHIFEPAIALINANTRNLHLDTAVDYRRQQKGQHQTWFTREEQDFGELFQHLNQHINAHQQFSTEAIEINHRHLLPVRHSDGLIWFTFEELCLGPRSAFDYIALGEQYDTILVSGIPLLGGDDDDAGVAMGTEDLSDAGAQPGKKQFYSTRNNAERRFISLIDELYDQRAHLYMQAAAPLFELYRGGRLAFEFERTVSRITEMQSAAYFRKPHR